MCFPRSLGRASWRISASWGAHRRGWADGARPRLRSGAFAPDVPVVIFVQACGLPFRFPRAHQGCAPSARPRRRAGAVLVRCAAGSLFTGEICVARLTRPRGRPHSAYALSKRRSSDRLRAGEEQLANDPRSHGVGWSDGWRAAESCVRSQTCARATRLTGRLSCGLALTLICPKRRERRTPTTPPTREANFTTTQDDA